MKPNLSIQRQHQSIFFDALEEYHLVPVEVVNDFEIKHISRFPEKN